MKKPNQSWTERIKKRNKLGFSLVELIVVVAIMAVMIAILAPSLLSYVERSRAQKDVSAMDEVTNAVFLAMADPFVYDELAQASLPENVACYVDTNNEDNYDSGDRIITKKATITGEYDKYTFNDDTRRKDETKFYGAGSMRGVTITFEPNQSSNRSKYRFDEAIINKFFPAKATSISTLPHLYNAIRSTIGDNVELTSQTYRNSEYTIFVKIGTTGGNQANAQDAMDAYGQFSGTNLPLGDREYSVAEGRDVDDPTEGVKNEQAETLPTPGSDAEDYTWEEIKKISEAGKGDDYFDIGENKTITTKNGITIVMEIVAFNADIKADGTGTAGITWMSKYVIAKHNMNKSDYSTLNRWDTSEMRAWLQNDFYSLLSDDVQNVIVPVQKTFYADTSNLSNVYETLSCVDTLWIPSYREIRGVTCETYGARYSDYFVDDASRIKYDSNGSITSWWTRTAYDMTDSIIMAKPYHIVDKTGATFQKGYAPTRYGVVIGFCT